MGCLFLEDRQYKFIDHSHIVLIYREVAGLFHCWGLPTGHNNENEALYVCFNQSPCLFTLQVLVFEVGSGRRVLVATQPGRITDKSIQYMRMVYICDHP